MGRFLFTMTVGVWLGTVVSFSFFFLPAIHAALESRAQPLLQRLFPRYYQLGLCCGLVALAAVSLAPPSAALPFPERVRLAFPVVVSLLCTVAAHFFLYPRLEALRRGDVPAAYERLHRFAAMLNSTVLAMLVLAVAAVTTR
jgi:hypothetical protein